MEENKPEKHEEKASPKKAVGTEKMIRVFQTDIDGGKNIMVSLTKIKGVSWSFANALCYKLKLDKQRKIGSLSEQEIKKIEDFIKNPELPSFLLNRRKDLDTGKDIHLNTTDLELRKDFDIKRLKKIRSYRGLRHALGQPVRGQRTKSHFRKRGKVVGVLHKGKIGKKS